ncbi:uncharacterized protein LOC128133447 [Lactuca sativa]|uniref:uncharacterized protein LOC128133447 n=1 Tax=Lactuca sativa TaxID=4236 RepID=UPI0022B00CAB|nr:uncharacterized protein LOC128133447 [Lactuca sativa]
MAKTRSTTRIQNHDHVASSSTRKRIASCDKSDEASWSDLDHNLLFLVMMQLGVIDFLAFSGVCKSWRSLALDNWKIFMASRPPMFLWISDRPYKKECYLEDFEGRKFKTILPRSAGRICVGITCGYLILFGWKTKDFRLVNPITRHELHFPCFPYNARTNLKEVRGILVSSPLVSGWAFVMLHRFTYQVWFSIAGTGAWNHVSSTFPFFDLVSFKGKIYTLNVGCRLCEMRLNPEPKLKLLQTKNFPKVVMLCPEFVSLDENLCVMYRELGGSYKVYKLDFEEMKWMSSENTLGECAFFINELKYSTVIKPELWVDHELQYMRYAYFHDTIDKSLKVGCQLWYFPCDCKNVNL